MSDWISTLKNQQYNQDEDKGNMWSALGAGGYSALDEILMGLPSFLVKNIGGKETWNKLDQFRKDNKLASDIGGGLGFIGSMLVPGGAIAKGAGKLAKFAKLGKLAGVLDKAGDVAKLSTKGLKGLDALKVGAKAGAVQALEQAIPRAITGLDKEDLPGSAMKGLQNIGTGALFGGATGATLGRLFDKLGPAVKNLGGEGKELASDLYLRSAKIDPRDVFQQFGGKGKGFKGSMATLGAEDFKNAAAKYGKERGLQFEPNRIQNVLDERAAWEKIAGNYNKVKPVLQPEELLKSPPMAEVLKNNVGAEDEVMKLFTPILKQTNLAEGSAAQKVYLNNLIDKGFKSDIPIDKIRGDVAKAIKDNIDQKILDLSDAPKEFIDKQKENYKFYKLFEKGGGKDASKMANVTPGSPTMEKLVMAGLGGLGGFTGTGGDITDPDVLAKKLQNMAIGSAIGGLASKGGALIGRKGMQAVGDLLGSKPITALIGEVGEQFGQFPGKLAGALPNKLTQDELGTAGGASTGGATPDDAKSSIMQTEAGTDPIAKEEAKAEFSDTYKDTIKRQLMDTFARYYQNNPDFPGLTFDQFAQMAKKKTENFDPVKSSKLLFPDNPEMEAAYLKKYETMLYLKNLDAEKALSKDPGILGFGGGYEDEGNYQKIRDLMINIASGGKIENMDSASMLKMVDEDLGRAMKAKGAKKAALMDLLTRKYGLDFSDLAEMGVL